MAQIVRPNRPSWLIDKDLMNLLRFWRSVPEMAAEWPVRDENSRLDFIHRLAGRARDFSARRRCLCHWPPR